MLKSDSQEYYMFSSFQKTIVPINNEEDNIDTKVSSLENILSDKGMIVFEHAKTLAEMNHFKDEFIEYRFDRSNSGSWFGDEDSVWFDKQTLYEKGTKGSFNTWNNINIIGKTIKSGDKFISTSPCVFIVNGTKGNKGWCYTSSGSLYSLSGNLFSNEDWFNK
jgi:hypothetical protein